MTTHYAQPHPYSFILAIREQAIKFTQAKPGDEYSYRVLDGAGLQFDQGVQEDQVVALEVGFQHMPDQKFAGNAASFSNLELIKPLREIISSAITPDFAAIVVPDTIRVLLNLGDVYVISIMPDHVILGFQKTNVIFVRHKEIVK